MYVTFSSLLSPHPSQVQIFSSTPCSQTPSVYVLRSKDHTPTEQQQNYSYVYSKLNATGNDNLKKVNRVFATLRLQMSSSSEMSSRLCA
jgi:hypothetical protein